MGRFDELGKLVGLLDNDARLITLTGSAGVGKTRLAAQVAAEAVERYPDGVWWVDLVPSERRWAMADRAPMICEVPGDPLVIVEGLSERRALLVLDNCEHLLDGGADVGVLRACADLTVLATSRAPLTRRASSIWRVPSLRYRTGGATPVAVSSSRRGAPLRRPRAPGWQGSARRDNVPPWARSARLDGIPLAMELAAARVGTMPVQQIAGDLDERFRLLTGGARTALPRHQTLAASVVEP